MGKLLALELFNFKSYKGHHVLQFGDSYFTSIIGPNGSGKSNSMDAISFVLGVKSSHLRSTHLKDLVYRGRVLKHSKINADGDAVEDGAEGAHANGHADGEGSDGEAEMATQTSTQRNDPQTAWVMAIYEDDAGEEQRWKRTITAAGQSEYRINSRTVTAKQYNESLEAENILIKARNFLVFQGDVEQIASQNPKDLTKLIELVSGSLEYKADYERLQAEKEKAEEEQGHKLHQRRGINGEIRAFQQQKDELDRYEALREEKDQAVITNVLWKLFHFQQTIEASNADIKKHQNELKEYRRNVKKHEDALEAAKREQAKVNRDVSKYEREIAAKEKGLRERENALVPIDQKLSDGDKKLQRYEKTVSDVTKERDMQQSEVDNLQRQHDTTQKAQKRAQDQRLAEQREDARALTDDDLQEYERLRGEVYKRSGSDQAELNRITRNLRTESETTKSLKAGIDSAEAQVAALENDVSRLNESRLERSKTAKTIQHEINAKQKEVNHLTSARTKAEMQSKDLDEKHFALLKELQAAQGQERESHKEAQLRETVATLRGIFPGVKDMVHRLCKPTSKKYELAVGMVLGRHWESLVVDTNKTAQECIDYLKTQRLGIMTILPLDTITQQQPNANFRNLHDKSRLAIDTIQFDTQFERVMNMVCGDAIVTDTVKIAKDLCYGRNVNARAIALDGTVISKGGNITGGSEPADKKRRFKEDDVEILRAKEREIRTKKDELPRMDKTLAQQEQLHYELSKLSHALNMISEEIKALDKNIDSRQKELAHHQRELDQSRPKYEDQTRGVETLRTNLERHNTSVAEVEDEVFADFCSRTGYTDIREYEKQRGAQHEEAKREATRLKEHISSITNKLTFAADRLQKTNDRLKKMQDEIDRQNRIIAQFNAEREGINEETDEMNAQIDQLNTSLGMLRESLNERGERVNDARREVQKRMKTVEKSLKEVSLSEAEIQKASSSRYAVFRSCKLENISLPLEEGSRKLDSLPLEDGILEQDDDDAMDIDDGFQPIQVNDYGILVDFSGLDDDLQEDDSEERETSLGEKVVSIQAELDKMAPNMRSAERLEQTSERLKATERDFNNSRNAAKQAMKEFETVKKKRMDLFNKAFLHISEQIHSVYRELTKTVSFPMGGEASLDAEDDVEPYLYGIRYHAKPALKKFRDMEHLSGGEKTMAALALLFAVHTFAPSPFFVLDEVDAALDNANTSQLARYVREHAGPGMQFVVISLKPGLFQNSETLVGVMRDQAVNSSRPLTLDVSAISVCELKFLEIMWLDDRSPVTGYGSRRLTASVFSSNSCETFI
nr:structural maintenance of chromosomes protein 1 [Quercus suber]